MSAKDPDKAFAYMNNRFALLSLGGDPRIIVDRHEDGTECEEPIFWKIAMLEAWGKGKWVSFTVEDPETGETSTRRKPLVKYWMDRDDKRFYEKVVFKPGGQASRFEYNLWRGFGVKAEEGDWGLFRDHLRDVVCSGDEGHFHYLLHWMANAVQNPGRPGEVAVVLRGTKGSGKGTVANIFGKLFGSHYIAVSNRDHLTGRFNAHLRDKVLLFVDEGFWAGSKESEGVLKQLITEPYITFEQKFVDAEPSLNCLHIIMASNESWVVPARGLERRFFVLDVADTRAQDTSYFGAIWEQMESGGYEAMMHDLLEMDLSGFDLRRAPITEALADQMLHSLSPFENWWFDRLMDGQLLKTRPGWDKVRVDQLHDQYKKDVDAKHLYGSPQFASELRKLVPGSLPVVRQTVGDNKRRRFFVFPSLAECREEWDRQHRTQTEWEPPENE